MQTSLTEGDKKYQRRAFLDRLKDPEGAQVQNVQVFESPIGNRLICGELNSTNSFGGKTGFSTCAISYNPANPYQKGLNPVLAVGGLADF